MKERAALAATLPSFTTFVWGVLSLGLMVAGAPAPARCACYQRSCFEISSLHPIILAMQLAMDVSSSSIRIMTGGQLNLGALVTE